MTDWWADDPDTSPPNPPPEPAKKTALRSTTSSSASYLPSEARCRSAGEPGGVTRGRSKPGEQSLRSRTWFIHVRDREAFPSHHLLSPPHGSPCALLAPPTSTPSCVNHAHWLVLANCFHASCSHPRTRAASRRVLICKFVFNRSTWAVYSIVSVTVLQTLNSWFCAVFNPVIHSL